MPFAGADGAQKIGKFAGGRNASCAGQRPAIRGGYPSHVYPGRSHVARKRCRFRSSSLSDPAQLIIVAVPDGKPDPLFLGPLYTGGGAGGGVRCAITAWASTARG